MPRFVLLVYEDETAIPAAGTSEWQALWDEYVKLDEQARSAGVFIDSQPFAPTSAATTFRIRGNRASQVTGPAEQTQTQLSGYYLLDCRDEAEAFRWAAKIPGRRTGAIEVRPIVEGA